LHPPEEQRDDDLEGLDGMVQRLVAQELSNYPDAAIAVVSDHSFASVEHDVNLAIPFMEGWDQRADPFDFAQGRLFYRWKVKPAGLEVDESSFSSPSSFYQGHPGSSKSSQGRLHASSKYCAII
jgi:hypothetical protein